MGGFGLWIFSDGGLKGLILRGIWGMGNLRNERITVRATNKREN